MKRHAFTLWELLAVIVIVAVVAVILFPVFAKARRHCGSGGETRQVSCQSNMKQLGLAIMQYASDNDDLIPMSADTPGRRLTWRAAILPLAISHDVYHCPDDTCQNGPDDLPTSFAANDSGSHLGSGEGAFAAPGAPSTDIKDFPDPKTLIMLCEQEQSKAADFDVDDKDRFQRTTQRLSVRHTGRSNYLFADGHVKLLRPVDTKAFWHRNPHMPLTSDAAAILQDAQDRAGK